MNDVPTSEDLACFDCGMPAMGDDLRVDHLPGCKGAHYVRLVRRQTGILLALDEQAVKRERPPDAVPDPPLPERPTITGTPGEPIHLTVAREFAALVQWFMACMHVRYYGKIDESTAERAKEKLDGMARAMLRHCELSFDVEPVISIVNAGNAATPFQLIMTWKALSVRANVWAHFMASPPGPASTS